MNQFLDIRELSEYLGIKKSTLYAKVAANSIPHYKIDHLIRFRKAEIDEWLSSKRNDSERDERKARSVLRALQGKPVDVEDVLEKNVVHKGAARYKSSKRETGLKSLKGVS